MKRFATYRDCIMDPDYGPGLSREALRRIGEEHRLLGCQGVARCHDHPNVRVFRMMGLWWVYPPGASAGTCWISWRIAFAAALDYARDHS